MGGRAVGVQHPDAAVPLEGDLPSVRRPGRGRIGRSLRRQQPRQPAGCVDDERLRARPAPGVEKPQRIGRPERRGLRAAVGCEAALTRPVGVHDPDLVGRVPARLAPGDPPPIRRPGRVEVGDRARAGVAREPAGRGPVRVHHVDLLRRRPVAVADEGEPCPVGRPGGRAVVVVGVPLPRGQVDEPGPVGSDEDHVGMAGAVDAGERDLRRPGAERRGQERQRRRGENRSGSQRGRHNPHEVS